MDSPNPLYLQQQDGSGTHGTRRAVDQCCYPKKELTRRRSVSGWVTHDEQSTVV
jgi:hypothetical protein